MAELTAEEILSKHWKNSGMYSMRSEVDEKWIFNAMKEYARIKERKAAATSWYMSKTLYGDLRKDDPAMDIFINQQYPLI